MFSLRDFDVRTGTRPLGERRFEGRVRIMAKLKGLIMRMFRV